MSIRKREEDGQQRFTKPKRLQSKQSKAKLVLSYSPLKRFHKLNSFPLTNFPNTHIFTLRRRLVTPPHTPFLLAMFHSAPPREATRAVQNQQHLPQNPGSSKWAGILTVPPRKGPLDSHYTDEKTEAQES